MSFLILDAMHRMRIPVNIALRVHDRMDRSLLVKALEYMAEDGTGVDFALSGGLDEGFARNGYPIGLARMRAKVGCNWTALPGIEYGSRTERACAWSPRSCSPSTTRSPMTIPRPARDDGRAVGALRAPSAASQWTVKEGKDIHMERQADNFPEIVLNLFCHGPIERGLDAPAADSTSSTWPSTRSGSRPTADSFAAIEQRVVGTNNACLWETLRRTWTRLRRGRADPPDARTVPHYGSAGRPPTKWAVRIASLWTHLVRDTPTEHGRWVCVPGLFSHGGTAVFGRTLGATPNGRRAGEPVSHSADPDPGFLPGGGVALTAKANAVASTQSGWGNTTPLQVEIDTGLMNSLGGIDAVATSSFAHNRQGGTLINMNIVKGSTCSRRTRTPRRTRT
jgi:pyruvate-formate lyase